MGRRGNIHEQVALLKDEKQQLRAQLQAAEATLSEIKVAHLIGCDIIAVLSTERALLRQVEIALDDVKDPSALPDSVSAALEKLWDWRKEQDSQGVKL